MDFLRDLLFVSDDFENKPYSWAANQGAHTLIGMVLLLFVAVLWVRITGEYPYKVMLFLAVLGIYLNFEILAQGWNGWDTITDTKFVVVYGGASFLTSMSEIEPGSYDLLFKPLLMLPWVVLFTISIVYGVVKRLQND